MSPRKASPRMTSELPVVASLRVAVTRTEDRKPRLPGPSRVPLFGFGATDMLLVTGPFLSITRVAVTGVKVQHLAALTQVAGGGGTSWARMDMVCGPLTSPLRTGCGLLPFTATIEAQPGAAPASGPAGAAAPPSML